MSQRTMGKTEFKLKKWVGSEYLLPMVLILAVSFGIYGSTLGNSFVYDDRMVVENNHFIHSWKNLPDLFTGNYFLRSGEITYRPVVTLSYFSDYALWKSSPSGYHLTNVLLHSFNACLVYYLVKLLFGRKTLALTGALLFALHPVNSEAVCAVAFREDLLVLLFSLAAIIFYRGVDPARKERGHFCLAVSLLSFSLALFSKEMAVILPAVLFLLDISLAPPGSRAKILRLKLKKYYWLYLLVLGGYLGVRFHWLYQPREEAASYLGGNFYLHLLTQARIFLSYLRLLLWPSGLSIIHRVVPVDSFRRPEVIFAVLVLAALVILAFRSLRWRPEVFFSSAYFLIALLPVANLIPLKNPMAERYLYMPAVGFCLLIACGFEKLGSLKWRRTSVRAFRRLSVALLIPLLVAFSAAAFVRSRDWRNLLAFYEKVVRQHPHSGRSRANLGTEYQRRGRTREALVEFRSALSIDPGDVVAHNGLGLIYAEEGKFDQAIRHYQAAKIARPGFTPACHNLGILYYRMERYQEAVSEFKQEIEYDPFSANAHYNLGLTEEKLENFAEAQAAYKKAVRLEPGNFGFNYHLANLYAELELRDEAIAAYKKAIRIKPEHAHSHYQLGTLYAEKGLLRPARAELETALDLNPGNARIYNNLGGIYCEVGNPEKARMLFEKALSLDPDLTEARLNLENLTGEGR